MIPVLFRFPDWIPLLGAAPGWRLLGLFLILHGSARAAIELLRVRQDRLAGVVTIDLLLALAVVLAGLALCRTKRIVSRATERA